MLIPGAEGHFHCLNTSEFDVKPHTDSYAERAWIERLGRHL